MTGCVKTKTVIVTKVVATIPPEYLYSAEPLPDVPAGVPPEERTAYLLEAYASRGDVIRRDQNQQELMRKWAERILQLYPQSVGEPLPEVEAEPSAPQRAGE